MPNPNRFTVTPATNSLSVPNPNRLTVTPAEPSTANKVVKKGRFTVSFNPPPPKKSNEEILEELSTIPRDNDEIYFKNIKLHFKCIGKAGSGAQGSIWLCELLTHLSNPPLAKKIFKKNNNSNLFAIKFIKIESSYQGILINREFENINTLIENPHPNIMKFFYADSIDTKNHFIISEFIEGSVLKRDYLVKYLLKLKQGGVKYILKIFEQLLLGLNHLHDNNICHRDIKNENIMVDFNHIYFDNGDLSREKVHIIKFIDFGLSCALDNSSCYDNEKKISMIGTHLYMAPEIVPNSKTNLPIEFVKKTDVFGLGISMFELLHNFTFYDKLDYLDAHPVRAIKLKSSFQSVKSKFYHFFSQNEDLKLLDFIINMMIEIDPDMRLNSKQVTIITGICI